LSLDIPVFLTTQCRTTVRTIRLPVVKIFRDRRKVVTSEALGPRQHVSEKRKESR